MKEKLRKNLTKMEIGGILFCLAASFFMRNLYDLCGGDLIGVLFGSVNDSVWECNKTILLPYLIWGMLELLSLQPSLHRLAVAKTISLYLLAVIILAGGGIFKLLGIGTESTAFSVLYIIAICIASAISNHLYFSKANLHTLFAPCLFLLFLFLAFYFSLTPFPLKNLLFEDSSTGLCGIIPTYIDKGATALDTILQINS